MKSSEVVGYLGERRSKVLPPANWVPRLRELPQVEQQDLSGGRLFIYFHEQTAGLPLVSRLIVTNKNVKLPPDIRENGVYRNGNKLYYHRLLDRPERMEELERMQRNNKIRIEGFFVIPPSRRNKL